MRQIRPRTSSPTVLPLPVPLPAEPANRITVDLRDVAEARHPSLTDEDRLRMQLTEVRRAVDAVMEHLAALIDQRENLKVALGTLVASDPQSSVVDDESVVAWGFYDDDL